MTRRFTAPGGHRLAYDADGREDPGIVFVHGWCCDRTFFAPQYAALGARTAVVSIDLAGHGESDPDPGGCSVERYADDVLAVAAAAGHERPVVVGHSLGGLVALACAARPGAVRAAVMVDPAPLLPSRGSTFFTDAAEAVAGDVDGAWRRSFAEGLLLPTDRVGRGSIPDRMARTPTAVAAAACRAMGDYDGGPALRAVTVPLLSVESSRVQRGVLDLCPSLTVGLTVGAGHFNQLEVPDQVTGMVVQFLTVEGILGPRRTVKSDLGLPN